MPRFSIILPSFLGDYKGAAKDRPNKLIRAIDSVLAQTFQDFEIIVVADGCEETYNLVLNRYQADSRIDCLLIRKQPLWTGVARNTGISNAAGEIIAYLDGDDKLGPNHLQIIHDNFGENQWVWFNDHCMTAKGTMNERQIMIHKRYQNGTSNFAHRRECKAVWGNGYGLDDFNAIQSLIRQYPKYTKIPTPEYIVCHVPAYRVDV